MRLVAPCLLVLTMHAGCQRVCGDLKPLAEGGAGAGGSTEVAGAGGRAGAGGSSSSTSNAAGMSGSADATPGGTSGAGAAGDGAAGDGAGGTAGEACRELTDQHIIDFDETDTSSVPALGAMTSVTAGLVAGPEQDSDSMSTIYRVAGDVDASSVAGFSFQFMPCVADASLYDGISFRGRANRSSLTLELSMSTAAGTGMAVPVEPLKDVWQAICIPFKELGDPKSVRELLFRFPMFSPPISVDLKLDDLAFYQGSCPTN